MKQLTILGSTGSIGCNALEIVKALPEKFSIKALAAGHNIQLLAEQIGQFHPEVAVVLNADTASGLEKLIPKQQGLDIMWGQEGYSRAATHESVDLVVSAMVGAAGLMPTLEAIDAGKHIALANKEALVIAGDIVMRRARNRGVNILPIDSEHSAVFQCVSGHRMEEVDKIFLTASGGPFLNKPAQDFPSIQPDDALNHPTWQMGRKITIDSATLMNKGLEVLEATHLFGISEESIDILIHPQSIVHSMVSFNDGSTLAQLGIPDMKGAIAYAMSHPDRYPIGQPLPDFPRMGDLTFDAPDFDKFPCLSLAYEASRVGGTLPAVLNAANEVAVHAFLKRHLSFDGIPRTIQQVMAQHSPISNPALEDILEADGWARKKAAEKVQATGTSYDQ